MRLGLTDWNRSTVLEEVLRRLSVAPYTNQLNHPARLKALSGQWNQVRARLTPPAAEGAHLVYEQALQRRPDDHWLHHNYAEFLKAIDDLPGATVQMRFVRDLAPHHYSAYLQLGRLLARQGQRDEARQSLEQALRLRPDLGEAYLELGQILASEGKSEDALRQYAVALRYRPDDPGIHLRRADLLMAQKRRDEAIQSLREAIRIRPSAWEARFLLGLELARDGVSKEAEAEFKEVVRLRPDHVLGQLNLGMVLARQDRYDEALDRFRQVLVLDPNNEKARQSIEAIQQFKPASLAP